MKNIIYTFLILTVCITGCGDELNVDPHTFASDQTYYKTEEQIKSAVNGIYAKLQDIYNGDIYVLTEMIADNTDYQYYPLDRGVQQREDINDFLMTTSNLYNENVWNDIYNGIQQTNVVIDRIGDVSFSDPSIKAQYEGEARFVRALLYFHLVRLYGSVPLRQVASSGPDDAFTAEKATAGQLYDFIMEDVKSAVTSLPPGYSSKTDAGRATRGAALTLLGEIYLTRADYANAVTTFTEVTRLGYQLMPAYAGIFDPQNKNNAESVFEIQYNASLDGENSSYIFNWGPRDGRLALTGFTGTLAGSNTPTLDIIKAYEKGDKRKDASIGYFVDPKNTDYDESFNDTAVFINKFYHPPYTINGRANENWPVYRYAHVILMLAEALNETGKGADAIPYINDVRNRAGLPPVGYTDQEQLREVIFKEIRVEVAFENHRWYQLLRTGKAIEIMTEHGKQEKARLSHLSPSAYNIKSYMLLYPLPERECRLNGFENNPGWN